MADIYCKEKRSELMKGIKGRGNISTEIKLRDIFHKYNITGWRRHKKITLSRKNVHPDFVFPGVRMAVFVDGCFWHGCNKHLNYPKSNKSFWKIKILNNMKHDLSVNNTLSSARWRVIRIWEHELKGEQPSLKRKIKKIQEWVHK